MEKNFFTHVEDGRLYVCGGYNGESCLSSCESYDPKTDSWSPLPNMARARSAAAATCFAGRLYVTGGCDVVQFFNSVEVSSLFLKFFVSYFSKLILIVYI